MAADDPACRDRGRARRERIDLQVLDWNSARDFYRRLGIEHLGEWLRYGGDAAALRRLAAEDLPDRD